MLLFKLLVETGRIEEQKPKYDLIMKELLDMQAVQLLR